MLVGKHFSREYEQKETWTKAYALKVRGNYAILECFELSQVGREDDSRADAFSRLASDETQSFISSIYLIEVGLPSIDKMQCLEFHQDIN